MIKKIAVLGSTGSTDTQTLEVVRHNKNIQVTALTVGGGAKLVEEQAREFKPGLACLWNEEKAKELRAAAANLDVKVASGMEGLMKAATSPEVDLVMTVVVGMVRIRPAVAAMEADRDIALANKETLVTTGHIIMPPAREKGVKLLPVDPEHSATFQYLQGATGNPLHKILFTASDDPLRGFTRERLRQVRLEDALKYPNWSMRRKIAIDSSTMVDKGLEVMETHWLFGVEIDQVQMTVQPTSIIHSMVEFEDGAIIAQLGTPDMRLSVQYAFYYPECRFLPGEWLDFTKLEQIAFEVSNMETFRGFKLAYEAGCRGGTLPTVFDAIDKMTAALLLERRTSYLTIMDMIEGAMGHHCVEPSPDAAQILEAERETYDYIKSKWN